MEYSYHVMVDGTPTLMSYAGREMRVVSHFDLDGRVLKSTSSTLDGTKVMESTRELIERGNKLEVIMVTFVEDKSNKIYQLYEREKTCF